MSNCKYSRWTVRRHRRRGAVMVEMAIVLQLLILLLIGLCVAELAAFRYHQVAALAHEGARWASVHGKEYAKQNNKAIATKEDILENVIKPRAIGLDLKKISHEVTWNAEASLVTVAVQYTWTPEYFFLPRKFSCVAVALATY
ncbi:MAG TPA: TadE/TadG family type IV pilus assembly protein [Pirellula sp.]|nr:TadE/TadG family type IV pilus assembly protein [Pirellula sp.]